MTSDLVAYLFPIDPSLLKYLDEDDKLLRPAVEQLFRYAVALLQGLVSPEHVKEDWEDFFHLAGAFVFAYGTERLAASARTSSVLWVGREPGPLEEADRVLLTNLVYEIGALLSVRRGAGGTPTR